MATNERSTVLVTQPGEQGRLAILSLPDLAILADRVIPDLQGAIFSANGRCVVAVCADHLLWLALPGLTVRAEQPLSSHGRLFVQRVGPALAPIGDDVEVLVLTKRSGLLRCSSRHQPRQLVPQPEPEQVAIHVRPHTEYVEARDGLRIPMLRLVPKGKARRLAILFV